MDGNTNKHAETIAGLVHLTENAILTMHSVRDTLKLMQEKDKKKLSADEELHDKIRTKTMKLIKGEA